MGTEPLPLEGRGTLTQGSSRGLSFPKCKRKSCTLPTGQVWNPDSCRYPWV